MRNRDHCFAVFGTLLSPSKFWRHLCFYLLSRTKCFSKDFRIYFVWIEIFFHDWFISCLSRFSRNHAHVFCTHKIWTQVCLLLQSSFAQSKSRELVQNLAMYDKGLMRMNFLLNITLHFTNYFSTLLYYSTTLITRSGNILAPHDSIPIQRSTIRF